MNKLTQQASLGDIEARETLYKVFYEDYQKEFDCWTKNLYSQKDWVDKEDIKQDIYMESVEFHINNHKYYNQDLPDDYLIKKSIRQTISQYVSKQTTQYGACMTEPHICIEHVGHGGNPIRLKAQSVSLNFEPRSKCFQIGSSYELKETLPDPNIKDPLDRMIYEEFVDMMLDKVVNYQAKYVYDLRKILILLLEGENSTNICRKIGISSGRKISNAINYLKNIKTNVFLPLALSIIDDERYTDKYWDVLSKKAKTLFFSQKST